MPPAGIFDRDGAAHLHRESGRSRTDLLPGVNTVGRCVDTGEQARSTMCGLTAEMGFEAEERYVADEVFPSDLSGHFCATLERRPELDRWRFEILDYQNNVLLSGLACSERQAAAIVNAWDQVIATSPDDEDPSMDWVDDSE
ncbi:hypothetical protein A6A27_25680 [Micromonospora sp. CB01531]|nr:hypothetical protein A6A27_25680 [Micromonospora sp. CB01531]